MQTIQCSNTNIVRKERTLESTISTVQCVEPGQALVSDHLPIICLIPSFVRTTRTTIFVSEVHFLNQILSIPCTVSVWLHPYRSSASSNPILQWTHWSIQGSDSPHDTRLTLLIWKFCVKSWLQLDYRDRRLAEWRGVTRQISVWDVIFIEQADIDSFIINLISNTEKDWGRCGDGKWNN